MPPVLTGVGAFATITPVPAHPINATANATSSSSSLSTSSSTLALTSSPTHPASSGVSSSLKGAIAGGVIGGLALIILTALLLMSFRRGRRFRKEAFEAQKTLRSQSSRDMSHFEQRPDLFYSTYSEPRSPYHPSQGSPSIIDSLEDSTAGPSINIQELAAEIAKNMRQTGVQGQEPTVGLGVILENPSANELPNVNSGRGDDSSRREPTRSEIGQSVRGRQLPRPPPSAFGRQTADDAVSVDTLPAYHADTHS
ncbi:hypothetical protein K439DRAFT_315529 [Ramaria rubella]|nr:hypothetical protein K439DRAFT_315529 [Ramaria rubella]